MPRLKAITELDPAAGRVKRPWRSRNHKFVLSGRTIDPARPTGSALLEVDSYTEALDLVERGHAIYMSDGGSEPILIPPSRLDLRERAGERLDDLWVYTLPRAPFRWKALEEDLERAMRVLADVLGLIANEGVAAALTGAVADGGAMRVTAILRAAYHSAFRGGDDRALSEEDFRRLDTIRKFLLVLGDGGQDGQFSPLHHTIYCAYLRHKIAMDDLAGIDLDQPFTRCLSALAGMSYEAARNSLAKAGVSTVREKLSHGEVVGWLEKRRDFPPLRECERPRFHATMAAVDILATQPLQAGFAQVRSSHLALQGNAYEVCRAEDEIAEAIGWQRDVSCDVLRRYAQSLDLCVDSFVDAFHPLPQSRDAMGEDS